MKSEYLAPLDLVFRDFAAQRVAMDAERAGCPREAAVTAAEDTRDEPFFKFAHRIIEVHALVDHVFDEPFEPVANHHLTRARAPWRRCCGARRRPGSDSRPRSRCVTPDPVR